MSAVFTVISAILLVAVFATGAFVGYLVIGRISGTRRADTQRKPQPPAVPGQVLDEFRGLVERLESRVREQGTSAAIDTNALPAPEGAEADWQKRVNVDLSGVLPDLERQLRELVAEIRRAHEAVGNPAEKRGAAASRGRASDGTDERDAAEQEASGDAQQSEGATETEDGIDITERRSRMRHAFCCMQWVAPYNGCHIPGPDEFFYVQCNDISSVGISFFMKSDPDYQMVVIRLASPRGPKFLTARIRRVTPREDAENRAYIIGCQFLGTIQFESLPPRLDHGIVHREKQGLLEGPTSPSTTKA